MSDARGCARQLTWSDGPGTTYAPHQHGHDEVIYVIGGSMSFTEVGMLTCACLRVPVAPTRLRSVCGPHCGCECTAWPHAVGVAVLRLCVRVDA
jgi:hypothetical protein